MAGKGNPMREEDAQPENPVHAREPSATPDEQSAIVGAFSSVTHIGAGVHPIFERFGPEHVSRFLDGMENESIFVYVAK